MRQVFITLTCITAGAAIAAPAGPNGFPLPTGRVTYSINSRLVHGKTVLVWAGSGRRFRQDITGSAGPKGETKPMQGWTICDGKFIYTHEQSMGKQVVKQDLPKGGPAGSIPMIGMSNGVGTVVGKETLLGKPCEIREVGKSRISVWQNLPLKMVADAPGGQSFTMVATKLEPNFKVNDGTFRLPAGFTVSHAATRRLPPPARKK